MLENFSKEVVEEARNVYGIDIPYDVIIEIILSIIQDCIHNERDFVSSAKTVTTLQRAAMTVRVCRYTGLSINKSRRLRDVILSNASELDENILAAGFNEGKAVIDD